MTESDDALRGVLRDLIPDYTGPQDPLPRVVASVRRRRVRQRALLAAGSVAVVSVVALAVPALLVTGGGRTAIPAGAAPTPTAASAGPPEQRTVHPVATGTVRGAAWAIGSTALESGSRRCLSSDDAIFHQDLVCFDRWKAGGPVEWTVQPVPGPGVVVTRVTGVAPAGTAKVRVRLSGGDTVTVRAVRTPTDLAARFFGLVVEGDRAVRDVTLLDAAGAPIGRPATDPGDQACAPGPAVACAAEK